MSSSKLKEALDNCLINFDRRVLVTDLLEEYALPYQEVNQTLEQYISQQEKKGTKYEKRFLLQGVEQNGDNEVYTVVQGESNLQEWLQKLKNSESSLYSVEVSGGGKAAAQIFKPMSRCATEVKGLEIRNLGKKANGSANGGAATSSSAPVSQVEAKKTNAVNAVFGKKASEASTSSSTAATGKGKKTAPEAKKPSPEVKKSPPDVKKPTEDKKSAKAANTKGIGNFFAPVGAKAAKAKDKDAKAAAAKPPTPKKMQDFFKKQTEKTPIKAEVKKQANTSVQLFEEEDEDDHKEAAEEASSDEEEKLEALKRDIITSDQEDDDEAPSTSRNKRRRIIDSDDDEDEKPQQKHEKKESEEVMVVDDDEAEEQEAKVKPKSETYLDDDGFVITIKPKKSNVVVKSKAKISPPTKKSPPSKKSPLKSKSKSVKSETPTSAPKTKQGNIMSFFTKK